MPGMRVLKSAALAVAVAAGGASAGAGAADAALHADLERVAQRRIFFGHQSVGVNLLEGLAQLAASERVPLHVADAFIAENGDPLRKLQSFEEAMAQQPKPVEVALMKFCYVDFTAETDASALFARYRATIDRLRAKYPGTTFVHVTAPLTDVQGGAKGLLKRLLGRAPYGTVENVRREQYNALLRASYRGREPIFDLARIESTAPDGRAVTTEWKGSVVPAMAPAFTDDGGHLNAAGKQRAARELISVFAALSREPSR
jgi:lysophospholipase L1-like esterase